jgi:hypothetical protein
LGYTTPVSRGAPSRDNSIFIDFLPRGPRDSNVDVLMLCLAVSAIGAVFGPNRMFLNGGCCGDWKVVDRARRGGRAILCIWLSIGRMFTQ